MFIVGSPFDFQKLCLKGGLDGLVFLHPADIFSPFVRWLENFFGHAEGSLLLTDIFPQKLGTLFQKTSLAPDAPST